MRSGYRYVQYSSVGGCETTCILCCVVRVDRTTIDTTTVKVCLVDGAVRKVAAAAAAVLVEPLCSKASVALCLLYVSACYSVRCIHAVI